ncbi:Cyclase family protein [Hibiscus syriacus]|uniref:Cyclase family protein n=1 Tax=Hibiscus syriacus TaxID=106335 RepID=A0A6A2Y8V2_HIBSY|nr:Cyclase family protein [Hibiscus syriacus]
MFNQCKNHIEFTKNHTNKPQTDQNHSSPPLIFLLLLSIAVTNTAADSAYPSVPTDCTLYPADVTPVPVPREVYGGGIIFDISHRYTVDMPSWGSNDGLGEFLWIPASMKNGSLANNSVMKLPTYTGTDAPGHMIDRYFDAGFDVDTLDLEVLNGLALLVDVPRDSDITAQVMESLKIPKGVRHVLFRTLNTDRRLMYKGSMTQAMLGLQRTGQDGWEVYDDGRIFNVSHRYTVDMPSWGSKDGLGQFLWLPLSMKNGSQSNNSLMKLVSVHTGTHVDAPCHMIDRYFQAFFDVDTLDLEVLNGPALLVDVPRDSNITAQVMEFLNIPEGVRLVLFRRLNTNRRLMFKRVFDSSYVGCTERDGIGFLSAACYDYSVPAHLEFFEGREVILVEGLKLDDVPVGLYNVHCLPLRLLGSEGSPIRCILIQ